MKYVYIDSSTLVSLALGDPRRSATTMAYINGFDEPLTSALSEAECQAGLCSQLGNQPAALTLAEQNLNRLLSRIRVVNLTTEVLKTARTLIRRHRTTIGLRTLDALHLATAEEFRSALSTSPGFALEYITSDQRQHRAFSAEGYTGEFLP